MGTTALPKFFSPLVWSYDISRLDPERQKKTIIINAINYGDLCHWRWIVARYGKDAVRDVLQYIPVGALRPRVRKLAALLFSIDAFNNAPRGTQREK